MNNITREKEKLSYSKQTNLYVNERSVCFVNINFWDALGLENLWT